jgi:ureidoglycolate hydrolase
VRPEHPASSLSAVRELPLAASLATREGFAPFGTLIEACRDDKPFGPDDAQLDLGRGCPRFYIMRLLHREPLVRLITRHLEVTQCLASAEARDWFIAVASPDQPDDPDVSPDPTSIQAFRIPGNAAIKLHRSTWHAGPYFHEALAAFFNLELSDTNQADHHTCNLERQHRLVFRLLI